MTRCLSIVLALSLSPACGLIFGGMHQSVSVQSNPLGAVLLTSPTTQNYTTPAVLRLERDQSYVLTLSAPGYTSQTVEIKKHVRAGMVVLDILLGVIPVIVDAATGGWYGLSPDMNAVTLAKTTAESGPDEIRILVGRFKGDDRRLALSSSGPVTGTLTVTAAD